MAVVFANGREPTLESYSSGKSTLLWREDNLGEDIY